MNVVNRDFRDWFFTYHLQKHLQEESPSLLCLLGGPRSAYLEEALSNCKGLPVVSDPSAFTRERGKKQAIALLAPQWREAALLAAEDSGASVWDLAAEFADYEAARMPKDYLLDEFHTASADSLTGYTTRRDAISTGYIDRYIRARYDGTQRALFNKVEIETVNRCNGTCRFCPVSRQADTRPFFRMKESLFVRIIAQLQELSYSGALGIFSNNEPMMDRRLPDFARQARAALPYAFLYIYTNGTLLTWPTLHELLTVLDLIHIDCYADTPELPPKFQELRRVCRERRVPPEKISFHLRNRNELLTTRAGTAPNRNAPIPVRASCPLPFSQMVVRPDGKVSQCCNDALGRVTLGNLAEQTIEEVWFGMPVEALRGSILSGGRVSNALCRGCDTIFTSLPYEERSLRDGCFPVFPDHPGFPDH